MSRVTRACPWASEEELKQLLKQAKSRSTVQRIQVVLHATVEPDLAEDIGTRVGVAKQTVRNWMSTYNRFGPDALFAKKPRKPSPRLLSDKEERDLMEPFLQKASLGQITTAGQIHRALEDIIGIPIHHSTVYRLLARYEWTKKKPRPKHPKGNPEVQEDYKKNSRKGGRESCRERSS